LIAKLKFQSKRIKNLQKQNLDLKIIINFLRQVRLLDFYRISNTIYYDFFKKIYQTLIKINKKLLQNVIAKRKINSKIFLYNKYRKLHKNFYEIARRDFFLKEIYNTLKNNLSYLIIYVIIFQTFFE